MVEISQMVRMQYTSTAPQKAAHHDGGTEQGYNVSD